jgi:hypothetical protein
MAAGVVLGARVAVLGPLIFEGGDVTVPAIAFVVVFTGRPPGTFPSGWIPRLEWWGAL